MPKQIRVNNPQQEHFRQLLNQELPLAARSKGWPIFVNHCFGRVIYDHVFGECWYNCLSRKSKTAVYQRLNALQLSRAIAMAQGFLDGTVDLHAYNRQSLIWRGKIKS